MRSVSDLADTYTSAAIMCEDAAMRIAQRLDPGLHQFSQQELENIDRLIAEAGMLRTHANRLRRSSVTGQAGSLFLRPCPPVSRKKFFKEPRFAVGDIVCALGPDGKEKLGTVVTRYEFQETWRYVVDCDEAIEAVFFEYEMTQPPYFP